MLIQLRSGDVPKIFTDRERYLLISIRDAFKRVLRLKITILIKHVVIGEKSLVNDLPDGAICDEQSSIIQRFTFSSGVAYRCPDNAGDPLTKRGDFSDGSFAAIQKSGRPQQILGRIATDCQFGKYHKI